MHAFNHYLKRPGPRHGSGGGEGERGGERRWLLLFSHPAAAPSASQDSRVTAGTEEEQDAGGQPGEPAALLPEPRSCSK